MTTQPNTAETLSSHTGRSWLERTQPLNPDSIAGTATTTPQQIRSRTRTPDVQTVEVSLPDVGTGQSGLDLSHTIHPTIVAKLLSGEPIPKDIAELRSDIAETPAQWGNKTVDQPATRVSDGEEKKTTKNFAVVDKQQILDDAVDSLCDKILARFPLGAPSVLQFVGAEPNHHIDEACARIASRLAERNVGRILLLDSDLKEQALTNASGLSKSDGITDVTNSGADWKSLVYTGETKALDFLPGGTHQRFRHPEEKSRLQAAVREMKQDYQFVVVSAGDAHGLSAKIWNDICEGTYLLLSLKHSNDVYAQSAVSALQSGGARVLGCVLTDVE